MKEIIDKGAFNAMQDRENEAKIAKIKAELLVVITYDINVDIINKKTVDCLDEYYKYIGHPMEITSDGLEKVSSVDLLRGLAKLVSAMDQDITCNDLESFL